MKCRMPNVECRDGHHASLVAFTIIEIMIALFMFAMVLTAIYSTWISILRGTKAGLAAAAEVQRSRVAVRTIEEALTTAQLFNENVRYYYFDGITDGDHARLSMTSRLPATFPGIGRYGGGDLVVRRVSFEVDTSPDGRNELLLTQSPVMATNIAEAKPYTMVLAKDVTQFTCEFWHQTLTKDWVDEWLYTNQLPHLVRVTLGLGKMKSSSDPRDLSMRIVALPAQAVAGVQGRGGTQR
jgi:type II secretory pathway pseudopilin PulG